MGGLIVQTDRKKATFAYAAVAFLFPFEIFLLNC